jgi:hypothetical protein
MDTKRKPRFMISLDEDTAELFERLQKFTGLSAAQTIQKLVPAHLNELHTYLAYLEQLPAGWEKTQAPFLIHSYGPGTLIDDIAKIDPAYKFAKGTSHAN